MQPYDMEVGAGTFHPSTFLAAVGPEPLQAAYVQPSRRPTDGRYGENGMEVTQFTYFQQVGGLDCKPVTGEITYGLERIAMYLQGVDSIFDLIWSDGPTGKYTYRDIYHQNEVEQSTYNFEHANVDALFRQFDEAEQIC